MFCGTNCAVQPCVRVIHPIDAYQMIPADYATHVRLKSMAAGCRLSPELSGHQPLTDIANDSCIEYRDLDFGEGKERRWFAVSLCQQAGGCVELALDDPEAETIATLVIPSSEQSACVELRTEIAEPISGLHAVYLRFHSCHRAGICKLNSFRFLRDAQ